MVAYQDAVSCYPYINLASVISVFLRLCKRLDRVLWDIVLMVSSVGYNLRGGQSVGLICDCELGNADRVELASSSHEQLVFAVCYVLWQICCRT